MLQESLKILVVDDEEDLCEILQFNLESHGYEVSVAYSAEEALSKDMTQYHLLLLDVMMGGMSGFKLAEKIRKELKIKIPIIFLTAKATENDLLTGFNIGADDYISKPFSINEVCARVKAVTGRFKDNIAEKIPSILNGAIILNPDKKNIKVMGIETELTKKEFEIFSLLVENQNRIFTREEIMFRAWSEDVIVSDRTVDVNITRLRKKLGKKGKHIRNKPGYGYYFQSQDD